MSLFPRYVAANIYFAFKKSNSFALPSSPSRLAVKRVTVTQLFPPRLLVHTEELDFENGIDRKFNRSVRGKQNSGQKGGREVVAGPHYTTTETQKAAQLIIHGASSQDSGTYTAVVTRPDGTQARAAVALEVASIGSQVKVEAPIFVRTLSDLAAKVGTRVRFLVELRQAHDVKVFWYHNDVEVTESPKFRLLHEGNFFCVDISPLTVADEGPWRCVAENSSGQASCSARLRVVVPKGYKAPVFLEELEAILTTEGTVSLECKVVGVPTPILKWYKDGNEIKAGDVFALTANPEPRPPRTYTCEAVNCMGRAISSSRVRVLARDSLGVPSRKDRRSPTPVGPPPKILEEVQDKKVKVGDKARLTFKVETPPEVLSVTWYNNGHKIELSDKYRLSDEGGGRYMLEIQPVELGDDGEWKVVVKNEGGYASSLGKITLTVPRNYRGPRFLEDLRALLTEEGLVSFECKVVGYPTPLLQWFKDGQELKPGDVYQLSGTNSLGKYSCIAKNCMGEAKSTAELTLEDIKSHLNEEEKEQLLATNIPPRFIQGLKSRDVKIGDPIRLTVQVTVTPAPEVTWYHEDEIIVESSKYHVSKEDPGIFHLDVDNLEVSDQGEWKCLASNDFGHSVTASSVKLVIPRHYKKPVFLEPLRAVLSQEGTVNLECKVIGVPQPVLKWFKDGTELKPGDIHRIISGEDGTCCLGTYTCEAYNVMGSASSSAALLGFEDKLIQKESDKMAAAMALADARGIARNPSLSTINEERSSQISVYESAVSEASCEDEKADISVSIDGREVSLSLYETPDISEAEARQIAEIYADEISDRLSAQEGNQAELPPLRFTRETSRKGPLIMEAMVIDVENQAFDEYMSMSDIVYDDARTEADVEELSAMEAVMVEEREALRSDIADLPEMEVWNEEQLSPQTVSMEGMGVAHISEKNIMQADLRSLSEQGISMLRTHAEEGQVLGKGEAIIAEEPQVMSAGAKSIKTDKGLRAKAEHKDTPGLAVAQAQQQEVLTGLEKIKDEKIDRRQAKRSIETREAMTTEEQQFLSETGTLPGAAEVSKETERYPSFVTHEAVAVSSREAMEQVKGLDSEERPSKKVKKAAVKKTQKPGETAVIQSPEVYEGEAKPISDKQVQSEHAKAVLQGKEGLKVTSAEVMEDVATFQGQVAQAQQAQVKEASQHEALVMEEAEVVSGMPKSLKVKQPKAQKAKVIKKTAVGVAQQEAQEYYTASQDHPQSSHAEETEADVSEFHSMLEPMQQSEHYGYEHAEVFEGITPEQQRAMQLDPSYREAVAVAIREGYFQAEDLSLLSPEETQAQLHQTLHEAVEGYEQMGMSGDIRDMPDYMQGVSDRAQMLTDTTREAVMIQEADVDYANLNVFNKEDMSQMLTVAEERSGSLVECIVVQEADLQSEAAIVSQRPAAHPERAVAGIVEGAGESATVGEPPLVAGMSTAKTTGEMQKVTEPGDKKRPADEPVSEEQKKLASSADKEAESAVKKVKLDEEKPQEGKDIIAEAQMEGVTLTPEQIQARKEELLARMEHLLSGKAEGELYRTPSSESLTTESLESEERKQVKVIDKSAKKGTDVQDQDEQQAEKKRGLSQEKTEPQKRGLSQEKTEPQKRGLSQEKTEPQKRGLSQEKTETQKRGLSQEKAEPEKRGLSQEKTEPQKRGLSQEKTEPGKRGLSQEKTEAQKRGLSQEKSEPEKRGLSQEKTEPQKRGESQEKTVSQERGVSQEKSIFQRRSASREKSVTEADAPKEETGFFKRRLSKKRGSSAEKTKPADGTLSPKRGLSKEKSPPQMRDSSQEKSIHDEKSGSQDLSDKKDKPEEKKKKGFMSALTSKVSEMKTAITSKVSEIKTAKVEEADQKGETVESLKSEDKAQEQTAKSIVNKDTKELTVAEATEIHREEVAVTSQQDITKESQKAVTSVVSEMLTADQQIVQTKEGLANQGAPESVEEELARKRKELLLKKQELLAKQLAAMKVRETSEEPTSELTSTSEISADSASELESVLEMKEPKMSGKSAIGQVSITVKDESAKSEIEKKISQIDSNAQAYIESTTTSDATLSIKKKESANERSEESVNLNIDLSSPSGLQEKLSEIETSLREVEMKLQKEGGLVEATSVEEINVSEGIADLKVQEGKKVSVKKGSLKLEEGTEGTAASEKKSITTSEDIKAKKQSAVISVEAEQKAKENEDAKKVLKIDAETKKEAEPDTTPKKKTEVDTKAKKESEVESKVKEGAEPAAKVKKEEADSKPKKEAEKETEVGGLAKKDAEVDTTAKKGTDIDTKMKKEGEVDTKAKKEAEVDTKAKKEPEVDSKAKTGAGIDIKAKKDTEVDTKAKKEAEAKAEDTRAKKEAEVDTKAKKEAEVDTKAKKEAEAKTEVDTKAKKEAEVDSKAKTGAGIDIKAKKDTEVDTKAKKEAEAKAEVDTKAKIEAEVDTKAKKDAEAKAEVDTKAKKEAEAKAKAEIDTKTKKEAEIDTKAKKDAEAKAEVDTKAKKEAESKAAVDTKAKKEAEVDTKAKKEAEAKAEVDTKAKKEAEVDAKAKKAAEVDTKVKKEAEAKAEVDTKAKKEAEVDTKAKKERLIPRQRKRLRSIPRLERAEEARPSRTKARKRLRSIRKRLKPRQRSIPRQRKRLRSIPRLRKRLKPRQRPRSIPRQRKRLRSIPRLRKRLKPRQRSIPRQRKRLRSIPRQRKRLRLIPRQRKRLKPRPTKKEAEVDTKAKKEAEVDTKAKKAAEVDTKAKKEAEAKAEVDTKAKKGAEADIKEKETAEADTKTKKGVEVDTKANKEAKEDTRDEKAKSPAAKERKRSSLKEEDAKALKEREGEQLRKEEAKKAKSPELKDGRKPSVKDEEALAAGKIPSKDEATKAKSPEKEERKRSSLKDGDVKAVKEMEDKEKKIISGEEAMKAKSPERKERKRSSLKESDTKAVREAEAKVVSKDEERAFKEEAKKSKSPEALERKRSSIKEVDTKAAKAKEEEKAKSPEAKERKRSSIKEADATKARESVSKETKSPEPPARKRSSLKDADVKLAKETVDEPGKAKSPEPKPRKRSSINDGEKARSKSPGKRASLKENEIETAKHKSPEAPDRRRKSREASEDMTAARGSELRKQEEILKGEKDEAQAIRAAQEKMRREEEKLLEKQEEERSRRESEMRKSEIERLNKEEKEIAERRRRRKDDEEKERIEKLDRLKKEEQEKIERLKKQREEQERYWKEEQEQFEKEEAERKKKLEKRKEELEKQRKEEEERINREDAERREKKKQRRLEEEKAMKEQEEKFLREEKERRERRRKMKEEEEKENKRREEERRKKLEVEREEKKKKKQQEREEEERMLKEEEERRMERRKKREEQDRLIAEEDAKRESAFKKKLEEEKKRLEEELRGREEMKRKREEELRLQGEEFLKKEEERRLKRMEDRKRMQEEEEQEHRASEERRRAERTKRRIEYSEKELIDVDRYGSLDRRSRTQTPDMGRGRDPKRRPKFSTRLQDRQVVKGCRVRMTCNIIYTPEEESPEIEWFKGGFPIKDDERIKISYYEGVASLEVLNASRFDCGEYTCTAKNRHGRVSTTCDLRVKGEDEQKPSPPTFTTSLRDRFVIEDDQLVLSCHVIGFPQPKITWLKDADKLPASPRFQTSISEEGVCKLIITSPRGADSGNYTCHAENRVYRDEISANIQVQALMERERSSDGRPDDSEVPRFISELCDQYVEENGTLTLQVDVAGSPQPEVLWLFNGRSLHPSGKFRISSTGHTHTLSVFQVTSKDLGTYSCRITNKYGYAYTLSTVSFGTPRPRRGLAAPGGDLDLRAPVFVSRPESMVTVFRDEEITLTCTVHGEPTPRVSWLKGTYDVSNTTRAHKTVKENTHTLVIRGAQFTDSGTYTVEAKNSQGTVRAYASVKVRELYRSRSYSPRGREERYPIKFEIPERRTSGRFIRDVPGKIAAPNATDIGKTWVSLSWGRPEQTGGAPVTAYKVESWILGEEARWTDLGVSPIPSFDVYNLKTDREYLFRVTPRANTVRLGRTRHDPQACEGRQED
ncbi:putative myosin light chain kinase [Penaeus vannamei]|uniref:Putative myosin light chain kinase n=1 Tax=Penaeus vannamei TaxID=6689 RepID=A0A423TFG6_PENVA|nr:putative myosin light chain kinase [Penaeus vannamei]